MTLWDNIQTSLDSANGECRHQRPLIMDDIVGVVEKARRIGWGFAGGQPKHPCCSELRTCAVAISKSKQVFLAIGVNTARGAYRPAFLRFHIPTTHSNSKKHWDQTFDLITHDFFHEALSKHYYGRISKGKIFLITDLEAQELILNPGGTDGI